MSNAADHARQLANLFAQMSEAVDAYRTQHFVELTPEQRQELEDRIQQLDDIHDRFTETAIEDTLNSIKGDLDRITAVTTHAQQSLAHLNSVGEVIRVVSAASALAEVILTADYGAIPQAIEDLIQAVPKTADKNPSAANQTRCRARRLNFAHLADKGFGSCLTGLSILAPCLRCCASSRLSCSGTTISCSSPSALWPFAPGSAVTRSRHSFLAQSRTHPPFASGDPS